MFGQVSSAVCDTALLDVSSYSVSWRTVVIPGAMWEVQRAARVVLVPGLSQVLLQLHERPSSLFGLSQGLWNVGPAPERKKGCEPLDLHLFILELVTALVVYGKPVNQTTYFNHTQLFINCVYYSYYYYCGQRFQLIALVSHILIVVSKAFTPWQGYNSNGNS